MSWLWRGPWLVIKWVWAGIVLFFYVLFGLLSILTWFDSNSTSYGGGSSGRKAPEPPNKDEPGDRRKAS